MSEQLIEDVQLGDSTSRRRPGASEEITISMFGVVRRVEAGKKLLFLCTLAGLLLGLGIALVARPWYQAEAVFLPPEKTDLSSVTSPSAAALLMNQDSTDIYLGLLASRSVADDVIERTGLMKVFRSKFKVDARAELGSISKFTVNKNQLIFVQVKWGDPVLAASIANAYLEALYRLNGQMVASSSSHREVFFESQLTEQKEALAKAETDLKTTEEQIGIVSPEGEAQAGLLATAQLQAQVGVAENRLAGLRAGATEQNPQVVEARTQLGDLQGQLARMQASTGSRKTGGGLASTRELPGLSLEYARKQRELKLREAVFNGLTQQYEKARLAAIDPGPQLQIVDRAIVPERKAGPSRRLCVTVGVLLGFFAGLGYLLLAKPVRGLYRTYRQTPDSANGA